MLNKTPLPWQKTQWMQLWRAKMANRLPHALLLTGVAGVGKVDFANHFIHAMLCENARETGTPCYHCHACRLISGRVHPNVLWIEPAEDSHVIKIDQIRLANEFSYQSALEGEYKFIIFSPAHCMNVNAANALLKTLEEPTKGSILILISDQSQRLPATIRSRCQRIAFTTPPKEEAIDWLSEKIPAEQNPRLLLNLANGAPLGALKLLETEEFALRCDLFELLYAISQGEAEPLSAALTLQDNDLILLLDFMLIWVMDLLRLQLGSESNAIINTDFQDKLADLTPKVAMKPAVSWMRYLQQTRAQICGGINLNKQLLIETVLIKWANLSV